MTENIPLGQWEIISSTEFAGLCMLSMNGDTNSLENAIHKLICCDFCGALVDPIDAIHEEERGIPARAACGEIWMVPAHDFNDM